MASSSSPSPPAPPAPLGSPWDAHAAIYEQVWERSTSLWGRDALVLGQLPSPTRAEEGTPVRFLDVACGAGSVALTAASLGYHVTATDLSPGMIERLKFKLSTQSSVRNITPRVVDGQTLDGLSDASFEIVCSVFGIFLFPDRAATWRSALRVLTPGGRLLATSWDANSVNVRMVRYLMESANDKVAAGTAGEEESPLQNILTPTVNRTVYAATFREELEESGFEDVTIHTLSHPMCFTSGEELVRGVLDNSAFLAMVGNKSEASLTRCILDYAQFVLDGVDPFGEEAKTISATTASNSGDADTHPLWRKSFALHAIAHVAVATKPTQAQ